jgi:hypothetical protein
MSTVLIQWAAALVFLLALWRWFRFTMGLRYARVLREEAREAMEAGGRRVVAEVPTRKGELELFAEDAETYFWTAHTIPKSGITGARLLLNSGVMAASARAGTRLPDPEIPTEYEGREHWIVRVYRGTEPPVDVDCGTIREGVSRDAARAVYEAVARLLAA